ncbi:19664_t:CDS:2 [Dentiscutata erythropus]|uniref:19664_t:CDS:1 n=1 Tax=Dentiscutata erythropus TaxID=1348616 RepID=A0A9N9HKA4_9GLOM|nr:19664_t:CDS:2 [Dentiscutata erythropus]
MHKVRRRRVVPVDVHSEDEDEFDVTREELELSDLSGSEASCEDSDIESENSHSDGEEEINKETTSSITEEQNSIREEESSITEEQSSIKEEETSSVIEEISSLVEKTTLTSNEENATSQIKSDILNSSSEIKRTAHLEDKQKAENDSTAKEISHESSSPEELAESLTDEESDRPDDQDLLDDNNKPKVLTGWQKKLLARQEYRKKLAEDPAFVPHLGEFWGHDDRFIRDELKNDFEHRPRNLPFAPKGRVVWGVNEPRGRWDHDGFEELMKMEEEERHRKEFQRRFQQRRGFRPRPKIYRHRPVIRNNILSFKINQNRMSNLSSGRRPLPSRVATTSNKVKPLNNISTPTQKPFVKEDRSDFKQKGVETTVESTSQYNNQKNTYHSRDTNSFRGGRGYSKAPLRTRSSRVHPVYHKQNVGVNGKNTSVNKKNANVNEPGQIKQQKESNEDNIDKDHKLTNEEPGLEAVAGETNVKGVTWHQSSENKELEIKYQAKVSEDLEKEESEVEIILDPPSRKTSGMQESDGHVNSQMNNSTESNGTTVKSEGRSENGQSPSSKESPTSPLTEDQEKERSQPTQSSKRYSTRRVATTPTTQTTEQEVVGSGVGPSRASSEIPASAPFKPRSMTLSDDKDVRTEEDNLPPQQPMDTPVRYYTPNRVPVMPPRNNNLMENNSGIAVAPPATQFESNGMVYYYDPNMYHQPHQPHQPYYYYPPVETKDGNDKTSYIPQPPPPGNAVLDNGVYYYYPVYYHNIYYCKKNVDYSKRRDFSNVVNMINTMIGSTR